MDLTKADSSVTLGKNDALMAVLPVFAGRVPQISLERLSAWKAIMLLYGVPDELRRTKIETMDYRALGRRILAECKEYMDKVNEQKLKKQ